MLSGGHKMLQESRARSGLDHWRRRTVLRCFVLDSYCWQRHSFLYVPFPCTRKTLIMPRVDVIFPTLGLFTIIVLSPVFIVLPLNLYGHYYLVTHIPPGFPAPTPTSAASEQKWLIPDERSLWWAKPRKGRKGWRRLSTVASKVGSMANADTNVEESEESESDISRPGSRKRLRRCRKCDGPKPEVGRLLSGSVCD